MTQEEQASVLARWLSGPPGTPPPPELDREVVESVYALRPELAPDPVVDLDEILGSVRAGPLAAPGAAGSAPTDDAGGEVVPFPVTARATRADAQPAAAGRGWVRWATVAVGGTSSLGLLVAAAAVLVFVALPQLPGAPRSEAEIPAASATAAREAPSVADAPLPDPAPAAATTEPPHPAAGAPVPSAGRAMQSGVAYRDTTTIPEVQGDAVAVADDLKQEKASPAVDLDAVAVVEDEEAVEIAPVSELAKLGYVEAGATAGYADAPPPAASPAAPMEQAAAVVARRAEAKRERSEAARSADKEQEQASEPADDGPVSDRAAAVPRDATANGWRRGVDKATQQVFDAALTEAEAKVRAGDPGGGAERLAGAVGAPARAGQYVAARAAALWLQAGDPAAAAAVARRGLALSSDNTPERSQLLLTLGDALAASGDAVGAAEAWAQGAAANRSR